MKIVVLAGGLSPERNVSLVSGRAIQKALLRLGHQAVLVDMFLGLDGYNDSVEWLFDAKDGTGCQETIGGQAPDLEAVRLSRREPSANLFGPRVLEICQAADAVFLGLHGAGGEDGRVQAAFDLLGIPYTGAGYLSSGMAMNKAITKRVMERAGIATPPWRELHYTRRDIPRLVEELPLPAAVKSINGGSSLEMALPDTRQELAQALEELAEGGHVIVEEKIAGRNISVGVLGERSLPAVEMIPQDRQYFDYAAKYQNGLCQEICPAPLSEEQARKLGETALTLHHALGLCVYSRADFILGEDGQIWCLEINTLPGMTPASLLPKEAAAAGLSYEALCQEILSLSMEARKQA